MSFSTDAPLQATATLLGTLTGVQAVQVGAPESIGTRVSAWVTLGGQRIIDKASQLLQREIDLYAMLGYRVHGAESTAETVLAVAVDDLITKFYAARKAKTGLFAVATTQVESGRIDLSLASASEYVIVAGSEFRIWPVLITVSQQQVIS